MVFELALGVRFGLSQRVRAEALNNNDLIRISD